jgi:hypothetical protein
MPQYMTNYDLLPLCARTKSDPILDHQLARQANNLTDWKEVPAQAEANGLGPLLYVHLKTAGATYPADTRREVQGLYLRHRHANQVRTHVLREILTAFQAAGIQIFVLKGMALAHLIYSKPGLRPMRDIDLLVKESQMIAAQQTLADLGFDAPLPDAGLLDKHLAPATRHSDGLTITVELHHNLFESFQMVSMTIDDFTSSPLEFQLDNISAQTLGCEDMLWHLCQHVAYHASIWEPIRLIWVADIVGFAEQFVEETNWDRVARQYPLVLNMLSLFHFISPLSARLQQRAGIKIGRSPQGIGQEFEGWPRISWSRGREKGIRQMLFDTFCPSEWWLRLHYGLGSTQSLFWYRWFKHPFYILGPFYLAEKIKLFWFQKLRPRLSANM